MGLNICGDDFRLKYCHLSSESAVANWLYQKVGGKILPAFSAGCEYIGGVRMR